MARVGPGGLRFLGSIEIEGPDGTSTLGTRQQIVLGILAARCGSVVSPDTLADAVWGDQLPSDPDAAMYTLVSRLRRKLPPDALTSHRPGYALAADPDLVDVVRFEMLLDSAERVPAAQALSLLDEARRLCRGPAFGAVADVDAIRPRAMALDELVLVAEERRIRALLDVGREGEAVAIAEQFTASHPLRERALALLMEALARSGRQTEGLRRAKAYRDHLVATTGLEPSAEVRAVEDAILQGEISPAPVDRSTGEAIRFVPNRVERRPGESISYATVGRGPSLLFMPGWISSLDAFGDGSDPRGALIRELARRFSVTVYDRYGTGLSLRPERIGTERDSSPIDTSLDGSVAEVRAVLSTMNPPVTVVASSCAGPAALLAAADEPTIERLVALGTYASGPATFTNHEAQASLLALVEQSWGLGSRLIADLVVPGIDAATRTAFARFQRRTASADVAADYLRQMYSADAASALARIRQPTLVIHYRDDPAVPDAGGRQIAFDVTTTEMMTLEGPYHTPPEHDVAAIASAITRFALPEESPTA